MNTLPIIAFAALALGSGACALAKPQAKPSAAAPAEATAVASLSDAECIAAVDFLRRADKATIEANLSLGNKPPSLKEAAAAKAIAALPADGLPSDFRNYIKEYTALVGKAAQESYEREMKIRDAGHEDAWDLARESDEARKRLSSDLVALTARYGRASLLGSGWEKNAISRARTDLRSKSGMAADFLAANPDMAKENPDHPDVFRAYLRALCGQEQPRPAAAEARALLEQKDILKRLDPAGALQGSLNLYGYLEGQKCAVRLPHDSSCGYTWKLEPSAEGLIEAEWSVVPTEGIRGKNPHGDARPITPAPSTPESAVAIVTLKKQGTANMRFVCTREGVATPLATKAITLHVRRADDFRPLTETGPMPDKPSAKPVPAGVGSLKDNECLRIHRYLQKTYCAAMEECARAVEKKERVQMQVISGLLLPFRSDGLPQDFQDYLDEHHNLIIRHVAMERALEDKESELHQAKEGISKQDRKALRWAWKELERRREAIDKHLQEKYPRACILVNDSVRPAIQQVYRSYNQMDEKAKQFYAAHPELKDASDKKTLAAYFRYLAAERKKEEVTAAAARRHLERLDALRLLQADGYASPLHCLYGTEGESVESLLLPAAQGCSWKLDASKEDAAAVQVEWKQMETAKLRKLEELGMLDKELPRTEQTTIAVIRLMKAGKAKLRFVCTREGDDEPLLVERAEMDIRAKDEDEF